jgi:hypothetical protein
MRFPNTHSPAGVLAVSLRLKNVRTGPGGLRINWVLGTNCSHAEYHFVSATQHTWSAARPYLLPDLGDGESGDMQFGILEASFTRLGCLKSDAKDKYFS